MLIDTFPAFLGYWAKARHDSLEEQIRLWADQYLASWPDLLSVQIEDYRSQGIDWREIARERIFPNLPGRLDGMRLAHDNLLSIHEPVVQRTREILGFTLPITLVIHVGLGCGAGWATNFRGDPAVLLGLENMVEEDWVDQATLESLLAHEISHLAYQHWRRLAGLAPDESPWGQLLDEGFAQYCESSLISAGRFHENQAGDDWLEWCEGHAGWLAHEFLRCVDAGEPVVKFFGSWFDIEGRSQTGYFLGQRLVADFVNRGFSLNEIALLGPGTAGRTALETMISAG